jgi:hypothetical protein
VAAVSLVDMGALDLATCELLRVLDRPAQGVAVVGVAGQRPGVQHELWPPGARRFVVTIETLPIYGPRPRCKPNCDKKVEAVCANLSGFELELLLRAIMDIRAFCPQ